MGNSASDTGSDAIRSWYIRAYPFRMRYSSVCKWSVWSNFEFGPTYSLGMKFSRMSICVEEIAVASRIVNSIKLSLPHEEVSLAQRPSLSHRESLEVISDLDQLVVYVLEF